MKQLLLIVTSVFIPILIFAQAETTQSNKEKGDVAREIIFSNLKATPFGTSALSNIVSNISLASAFNKGENAKAELKYSKNWWTTGLSLNQKIDKKTQKVSLFDLTKGITPGTTIELNIQKMFWDPLLDERSFNKFNTVADGYARRMNVDRRTVSYSQIMANGTRSEIDLLNHVHLKQPKFFNAKVSFTKTNYSYSIDSFSLKSTNESFITPTIAISIGVPLSLQSFIALTYNYAELYQANDEKSYLVSFGSTANLITQSLIFGAPAKKLDNQLSLEWRVNFNNSDKYSLGFGPSAALGLTSKQLGIYLPVYFINSKNDEGKATGLQGGFHLGYVTSTKKGQTSSFKEGFDAQIIVSAPFTIFKNL